MVRLARYAEHFAEADSIRICNSVIALARCVATRLGDREPSWVLLSQAAGLEVFALAAEARLDEELAA